MEIVAHRGFSARHPEMTRAAYAAAIAWSERTGVPLGLECDVHFSADGQLICLHDLRVDRTSDATGPAVDRTVAELRRLDFSMGRRRASADERALVTLAELIGWVAQARERGAPVRLVIETKHPNPRGLGVETEVARLLRTVGWHRRGSPAEVITFSLEALEALAELLPELRRTLLIEKELGPWASGRLPDHADAAGPDLELLRADPGFVARVRAYGRPVSVWTVNRSADVRWCRALGVASVTTDAPDRVHATLTKRGSRPVRD